MDIMLIYQSECRESSPSQYMYSRSTCTCTTYSHTYTPASLLFLSSSPSLLHALLPPPGESGVRSRMFCSQVPYHQRNCSP